MNTQILSQTTLQVERASFDSLRRILVVGSAGLLEEGVARLLTTRQNLEVFHADDLDVQVLALKVAQIHPNVIILCHIDQALQNGLIAALDGLPTLADLRIIVIHLRNMALEVYQDARWFSTEQTEFFPLVCGENADLSLI